MIRSILLILIISSLHIGTSIASEILGSGDSGSFVLKQGKISFESTPEWKKDSIASASTYKEIHPLKIIRLDQGQGLMLVGGLMEHLTGGRLLWHVPPCHGGRSSLGSLLFLGAGDDLPKLAGIVDSSGSFSVRIPPEMIDRDIYLYFGGTIGGSFQMGLDSYTIRSLVRLRASNKRAEQYRVLRFRE
jgi:hypothetical protein